MNAIASTAVVADQAMPRMRLLSPFRLASSLRRLRTAPGDGKVAPAAARQRRRAPELGVMARFAGASVRVGAGVEIPTDRTAPARIGRGRVFARVHRTDATVKKRLRLVSVREPVARQIDRRAVARASGRVG